MTQTSMNQRLVRQRKTFLKPVLAGPSYNRAFSQAFPGARKNESGLLFPALGGMRRVRPHGNWADREQWPSGCDAGLPSVASVEVHLR